MSQWVSEWVSEWQGHLLSRSGQLKTACCPLSNYQLTLSNSWQKVENVHSPLKRGIMWRKLRQRVFTSINFFSAAEMEGSCRAAPQIVFIISFEKCFLAFNWVIEPLTNSPIEAVRGWYSTVQDIQHTHQQHTHSHIYTQDIVYIIHKIYNTHRSKSATHNIQQSHVGVQRIRKQDSGSFQLLELGKG